jgi:MFS family permease
MKQLSFQQAWTIWLITSLFSLFQFFLQVASNMMAAQYMQSFHINAAEVGALSSAFFYSYVMVQIPAGLLFDHFHLRRVLIIAVAMCGTGCALFSLSPNFLCAFLSRLLMGAGGGFAFVGMVFACADSFSPKLFTMAVGLGELVGMVGTSIGQKLVPHIVITSGWRSVMLGCAAVAALLFITMIFKLQDHKPKAKTELNLRKKITFNIKQVVKIPTVWLAGIFCCGMFAVVTTFASLWGVPFLQAVHHQSYLSATSSIALILSGIAIGGPTAGWLYGRMASVKPLLLGCGSAALTCTLLVMYFIDLPHYALDLCLFGMGLFCSVYVTSFSVVEAVTPLALRGTALGLCNAVALLGAIIFQPLSGIILTFMQHHSTNDIFNYQIALVMLPAIMCVGLIAISMVPRQLRGQADEAVVWSEQSIKPTFDKVVL